MAALPSYSDLGDEAEALALTAKLEAERERRDRSHAERRRAEDVDDLMDKLAKGR